jgi:DNA repair protein RecO (recombination protein O)
MQERRIYAFFSLVKMERGSSVLEKVEGVIIKSNDYSESHKIVTVFSNKFGKISALARGAKKPKSRMAAVTQPFILGQFFIYVNSGLSTIQQGEVIDSFRPVREDIIKTAFCAYIVELTDKLTESKKPDHFIYEELLDTMKWIEKNEEAAVPIMMFELKIFKKGGFSPTVDSCSNCGRREELVSYSIREAGLLCNRCKHIDPHIFTISPAVAKLLYMFSTVELKRVGSISVKQENINILRKIIDAHYEQYGGYFLKSRKVINQLHLLK